MKYSLELTYRVHAGTLTPYHDALRTGRALASRCTGCGHVAFPPRPVCAACGSREPCEHELPGRARIITSTTSGGEEFALVQLEGSDTYSLARLTATVAHAATGRVIPSQTDMPGLWIGPGAEQTEE